MEIYPNSSGIPVPVTKEFLFQSDTLENEKGLPVPTVREMFEIFEERLKGTLKDINWELKTIEASNMHLYKPADYVPEYDHLGKELPIPFEKANKTITKFLVEWISDIEFEDEVRLYAIQSVHYRPRNVAISYAIGGNVKRCTNGLIAGKFLKKFARTDFDADDITLHLRDWVRSHEDVVKQYTSFIQSQKEQYLSSQEVNQYIGAMIRNAVNQPQKIIDVKDFLQGVRNLNDPQSVWPKNEDGGIDKWSLFNHFTESLKKAEISDRAEKHARITEYFTNV